MDTFPGRDRAPAITDGAERTTIFISFRGSDSGSYAAVYLDELLPPVFGSRNVFRSSRSIPPGAPFPQALQDALARTGVLLVLIGRDWLSGDNGRRLHEPGDWVRREIAASLRAGIPVVPVLLSGAVMPKPEDLPADIAGLAERQSLLLRHRHIDLDAAHLIEQVARLMPRRAASGPTGTFSPFQTLIEEKTRDFVGREHVFAAIEAWFASNPNGYLTLHADPGFGKSSIVARYAQHTGCVAYFNQRATGQVRSRQFQDGIGRQLRSRFSLGAETELGALPDLLDRIVPLLRDRRLVIAVDALDEVDLDSQDRNANVLYLPPQLPENVYFLLTRREVPVPMVVDVPLHTLDLMASRFDAANMADAREYLRRSTRLPGVADWISGQGLGTDGYVAEISRRSGANFMYLRHVVQDIAAGRLHGRGLGAFPEGLENYYASHWRIMGMDSLPLPRPKLRMLYVLLEYGEPLSLRELSAMSGESATSVAEVLREWGQFLRKGFDGEQTLYGFYHESFADFLRRDETLAASRIDLEEINGLIVDHLYQTP